MKMVENKIVYHVYAAKDLNNLILFRKKKIFLLLHKNEENK